MTIPASLADLDVIRIAATLTNTGDGLSQAMKIDPADIAPGDVVFVLAEATVQGIKTKPIDRSDPGGPQELAYVMKAGTMTLVAAGDAKAAIDAQKEKNRLNQERQAGVASLPVDGAPRDADGFYDPAAGHPAAGGATKATRTRKRALAPVPKDPATDA